MRRVALLTAFLAFAGCAEGDGGVIVAAPDSSITEDTAPDTSVTESAPGTDADAETLAEAGTDTAMPDTAMPDTAMPDTAMPDTAMPDTAVADMGADTGPVDAGPPYTHTISVDGTNDFDVVKEKFATTSSGYDAYVAWDETYLYVAYSGTDIGTGASVSKWLFVYIDRDPGMSTGATSTERYNTQALRFPTGFGAEAYARYRTDNMDVVPSIKTWDGSSWAPAPPTMTRAKLGAFVELRIPRATLGVGSSFGVVTFMINEASTVEWSYAGLFAGNFTDGYSGSSAPKTLSKYLLVDPSAAPPSASSRIKP